MHARQPLQVLHSRRVSTDMGCCEFALCNAWHSRAALLGIAGQHQLTARQLTIFLDFDAVYV